MLRVRVLKQLKRRVLAKSFQVGFFIAHFIKVVYGNHFENLHIARVLDARVSTASVYKGAEALLVALKVIFQLKFIVFLLVEAEAGLVRHLALGAVTGADERLLLDVFGSRVTNMNPQLAERQSAGHVVDLPVAFERVY